jgi:hypothetical protein
MKPSDEHENWWSKELASFTEKPSENPEESPYTNDLPGMEEYRKEAEARQQ